MTRKEKLALAKSLRKSWPYKLHAYDETLYWDSFTSADKKDHGFVRTHMVSNGEIVAEYPSWREVLREIKAGYWY